MNQEELKQVIDYDPLTGIFTWKSGLRGNRAGALAGSACGMHKLNYIKVNTVRYRADKLAIFYMTGKMPKHVEHSDGDRKNDSYKNLIPCESKPRYAPKKAKVVDPRKPLDKLLDECWRVTA